MPTVFIHIFIHGTILAGYFFLNPYAAWMDTYDENCSAFQSARAARTTMTPSYAELIRSLGLEDLTQQATGAQHLEGNCAAAYIVRSFHQVFQHEMDAHDVVQYYTFGWSGLLSERERQSQALVLYQNLRILQHKLSQQYPEHAIAIRLYGHSHGGQLIAHLARVDEQLRRENQETLLYPLETAFLCATPLVPSIVQLLIISCLFRWIINITSRSDRIQAMDIVSTPGHFCTQRIAELHIPLPSGKLGGSTYIDLEVAIEDTPQAVNHSSFFSCNNYRLPGYLTRLRTIKKTIDLFRPLPILVWYPALHLLIQRHLYRPGYHHAQANIYRADNDAIQIMLTPAGTISDPIETYVSKKYLCQTSMSTTRKTFIERARTAGWNHFKRLMRFVWFWRQGTDSQ